jgi:hypothetical protein
MLSSGSSIDNFIYIWDLKNTRSPAFSLPAVTGASQVTFIETKAASFGLKPIL